jgi:hypothetical protein
VTSPPSPRSVRVAASAVILSTAGCAYLVTERALSPQFDAGRGEDGVAAREAPWTVYILYVKLSGDPNEARWEDGGRSIRVRSLPLSTTLWSFGPLLPILPRFRTNSEPADLEIDVSVSGARDRVVARPADFALSLPDHGEPLRPSGVRVPASAVGTLRDLTAEEDAVVELSRSTSMRLVYPVDRSTLDASELAVRLAADDGSWTFERSVRFVRGGATFVMTVP